MPTWYLEFFWRLPAHTGGKMLFWGSTLIGEPRVVQQKKSPPKLTGVNFSRNKNLSII